GAVALLWSALPALKGNIGATENALNAGAHPVPLANPPCGPSGTPNAFWGYGTLDALGSFNVASTVTVARSGSGNGSVVSAPAGIACGAACAAQFQPSSPVTLTATPNAGSMFTGWLG